MREVRVVLGGSEHVGSEQCALTPFQRVHKASPALMGLRWQSSLVT
jgi:hypothetical protein